MRSVLATRPGGRALGAAAVLALSAAVAVSVGADRPATTPDAALNLRSAGSAGSPGPSGSDTALPAAAPWIRLTPAAPTELKVSWGAAPRADRYRIIWTDLTNHRQGWSNNVDYTNRDRPVTLAGLLPGHVYQVSVFSFNDAGEGGFVTGSRPTRVNLLVAAPRTPTVVVTTAGTGELKVFWTPVAAATRYRLGWVDAADHRWVGAAPDHVATDSPVTLTGLHGGIPTEVEITAYGDGGSTTTQTAPVTPLKG